MFTRSDADVVAARYASARCRHIRCDIRVYATMFSPRFAADIDERYVVNERCYAHVRASVLTSRDARYAATRASQR